MYSVYQHWDPLKVCVVGRSYPPEFYSWIKVPHVRKLFERIAIETEEDFQCIIKKLKEFGVTVYRPDLPRINQHQRAYPIPPMTPRDHMCMIGQTFYEMISHDLAHSYSNVKDPSWPDCTSWDEFFQLPQHIQFECLDVFGFRNQLENNIGDCYKHIFDIVNDQGNTIKHHVCSEISSGAAVSRIGKDLYFGTESYDSDLARLKQMADAEFPFTRNHIINTGGHSDGTFCPVCPGLIISLKDVPTYAKTFPDWEVVYLPGQTWDQIQPFLDLKEKNQGKWWIPGFEYDQDVVDVVENWMGHWTGCVEETVFDVNMLVIDPKNVMVFGYNKQVFDALARYGITPHVIPLRHRYFWDGGLHCVTLDLDRTGTMQDFFETPTP